MHNVCSTTQLGSIGLQHLRFAFTFSSWQGQSINHGSSVIISKNNNNFLWLALIYSLYFVFLRVPPHAYQIGLRSQARAPIPPTHALACYEDIQIFWQLCQKALWGFQPGEVGLALKEAYQPISIQGTCLHRTPTCGQLSPKLASFFLYQHSILPSSNHFIPIRVSVDTLFLIRCYLNISGGVPILFVMEGDLLLLFLLL